VSHTHDSHSHDISADADSGRLRLALGLILAFMAAEVVTGIVANSLALLSDAAHMLTDAAALTLSLVAIRLARRPPGGTMTFGLKRVEILSAQANGITLVVLAVLITLEALRRLFEPPEVEATLILVVALTGVAVNLAATAIVARANRQSLNVEGSFQHLVTDLYAFIGTAVAAIAILLTGFDRADAIASLLVAALMFRSAYGLLRESGRVFLEASPKGMDPNAIGRRMAEQPGVVEVHDLHVWEVTSEFPALSAHVVVAEDAECHKARLQLAEMIERDFDIHHTTLQVEHRPKRLLQIE
jgi:cobalt-zinc-cadmium efflux system protein